MFAIDDGLPEFGPRIGVHAHVVDHSHGRDDADAAVGVGFGVGFGVDFGFGFGLSDNDGTSTDGAADVADVTVVVVAAVDEKKDDDTLLPVNIVVFVVAIEMVVEGVNLSNSLVSPLSSLNFPHYPPIGFLHLSLYL